MGSGDYRTTEAGGGVAVCGEAGDGGLEAEHRTVLRIYGDRKRGLERERELEAERRTTGEGWTVGESQRERGGGREEGRGTEV